MYVGWKGVDLLGWLGLSALSLSVGRLPSPAFACPPSIDSAHRPWIFWRVAALSATPQPARAVRAHPGKQIARA